MKTPRGNARAVYWARGLGLPPWGAFSDQILVEVLEREREEKIAAMKALAGVVGRFMGLEPPMVRQTVAAVMDDYTAEVHHWAYDLSYLREKIKDRLQSAQETKDTLAKVESMGVD